MTLTPGNIVAYAGQHATVVRVTESSAVLEIPADIRTIITRFGRAVTFRPAPKRVRISPHSPLTIVAHHE